MVAHTIPRFTFRGSPGLAAGFLPLLREGVRLSAPTGLTLRQVMEQTLGMAPDYVTDRVLTVFLNGSPVDDIDQVRVREGSEIGLGAAMPGLAGISMRRGSPIKAFREAIAARPETQAAGAGDAALTVKLFNLVADEAGAEVLRRGVGLSASRLAAFLAGREDGFWARIRGLEADGLAVSSTALLHGLSQARDRDVTLSVIEECA